MRIPEKRLNEYPWLVRLILWAQKKKYGQSLLPIKLWGRAPKVLYGLQILYSALDRSGSPLDPVLRSLINVRVSQINHCSFCVDIGSGMLQKRGVPLEKIAAVGDYQTDPRFTEKERVALLYAEVMTKSDQKPIEDDVFLELSKHFTPDEIVELTALIAYQNLSSKFNAALGVPPQGFCSVVRGSR